MWKQAILSIFTFGCASSAMQSDAGGSDGDPLAATITQACAAGVPARAGFLSDPDTVLTFWNEHNYGDFVTVLARRTTVPSTVLLWLQPYTDTQHWAECGQRAEHEVIDGLGWVAEGNITIEAKVGRSYCASNVGTPLADCGLTRGGNFFEPEVGTLAPDEDVYHLVLRRLPEGTYELHRRSGVSDGFVSGARTISGEPSSIESFRNTD